MNETLVELAPIEIAWAVPSCIVGLVVLVIRSIRDGGSRVDDGCLRDARYPRSGRKYKWPKGITSIGTMAFCGFKWRSYNQPFSIPKEVTKIGSYAFSGWDAFNRPNCRRAFSGNHNWLRIDDWVFAGCWSGRLSELRERLDNGYSTPKREAAWLEISKELT